MKYPSREELIELVVDQAFQIAELRCLCDAYKKEADRLRKEAQVVKS